MALLTTAEAKTLLGISGTTYDTSIATWIPYVEDDIVDYLGHAFQDGYVYRQSITGFEFVNDTDGDYVTDTDGEFLDKGFSDGMDVVIEGGFSNVGLYNISSASATKLTMTETGEFVNQKQNDTKDDNVIGLIRISRVKWPKGLKPIAAKMVWYQIENAKTSDVLSESLDDYSVTYAGSHAYPKRVIDMLAKYRKPVFR